MAATTSSGQYSLEDILPILHAIVGQQGGMGNLGMQPGQKNSAGMHVPIGPQFQQSYKTRKGQLAAGIGSVIGNVLIANKNMGDPLGLPWWLGGMEGSKTGGATGVSGGGDMGPNPAAATPRATQLPATGGSQQGNLLAAAQNRPVAPAGGGGGGGIMGLLSGILGGGGGGGGGMSGLGGILGMLG